MLEEIAINGPNSTLADLVRGTRLPKSTVHRIATSLVRLNVLEFHSGRYKLGLRLFELARGVPEQNRFRELTLPFMADLYEATHETVHLGVLVGREVLYIDKISGHRQLKLPSRVGGRCPAHCTAVGKVMLAFSPPEILELIVAVPLERLTCHSITVPQVLRDELAVVEERGVAFDREESTLGVHCVAAPIFGLGRRVVGAISVASPTSRLDPERLASAVRTAALGASRVLTESRRFS